MFPLRPLSGISTGVEVVQATERRWECVREFAEGGEEWEGRVGCGEYKSAALDANKVGRREMVVREEPHEGVHEVSNPPQ